MEEHEKGPEHARLGSYISDHPTNFNWRPDVARLVGRVQSRYPWQTYANTYWWHPPYDPPAITKRYDEVSVDFWGGGTVNGRYAGYRGKTLPKRLGDKIHKMIFYDPNPPYINWILWQGWMWSRGGGWERYDPYDPYGADMGHYRHLHITFV